MNNILENGTIINIILLGKTGSGKSATGNTLLRRKAFKSTASKKSITNESLMECSILDGDLIRVVDTPGLMDTSTSTEKTLEEIYIGMSLCPEGFNAILFVIPWNIRFTKEEKETLELLQKSFGDRFIKDYCIIAMTKGETFDDETDDLEFSEWLDSQEEPPEFFKLIKDCQKRVVFFSNVGKDKKFEEKRKQSSKQVLDIIKTMPGRYTSEDFDRCAKEREKLSVEAKLPAQKQYVQQELSLINQVIQAILFIIDQMKGKSVEEINQLNKFTDQKYQELEERIRFLIKKIKNDDKGTGLMDELLIEVKSYLKKIQGLKKKMKVLKENSIEVQKQCLLKENSIKVQEQCLLKENSIKVQEQCLLKLEKKIVSVKNQSTGWGRFFKALAVTIGGAIVGAVVAATVVVSAPVIAMGAVVAGVGTAVYQAVNE